MSTEQNLVSTFLTKKNKVEIVKEIGYYKSDLLRSEGSGHIRMYFKIKIDAREKKHVLHTNHTE